MASNVDIAEDARFKFKIIQTMFNHVAYADNASQLAVAKHRHVAHAMASHQVHQGVIVATSVPFCLKMLSTFMVLSFYILANVDAAFCRR